MTVLVVIVVIVVVAFVIGNLLDKPSAAKPQSVEEKESWTPPTTFDGMVRAFAQAADALSIVSEVEMWVGMDVNGDRVESFISLMTLHWGDISGGIDTFFHLRRLPKAMGDWMKQFVDGENHLKYRTEIPVNEAKCGSHYEDTILGVCDTCRFESYKLRCKPDEIGGAIAVFPKTGFPC